MDIFGAQLMVVRWQQGRLGEILSLIEQAALENPSVPAFRAWLALAHYECGHREKARRLLEVAQTEGFENIPRDTTWLSAVFAYAELAGELGHQATAEPLFDLLEPSKGQFVANAAIVTGPVAQALAGLATAIGRYGQADALFAEAEQLNDRMGAWFFGARNDVGWGRMLLTRREADDAERGRTLLERARESAVSRGYATTAKRAELALVGP